MKNGKLIVLVTMFMSLLMGMQVMAADSDFVIKNGILSEYKGDGGDVTIPEGVTSITGDLLGGGGFSGCSGLTSVVIPDTVTRIGDNAFSGCSGLTSMLIPDSVTYIGYNAFSGCSGLSSVIIPDSVTRIESGAFSDCSNLISVTISNKVTTVAGGTFSGCSSLTDVVIPSGVTLIGSEAFLSCSSLKSVTVPSSVTSIWDNAFSGCSSLTDIYYLGNEQQWTEVYKFGANIPEKTTVHYSSDEPVRKSMYKGEKGTVDGVKYKVTSNTNGGGKVAVCGISNKNVTSCTIPATVVLNGYTYKVEGIDNNAFANCSKLKTVNGTSNLTYIGDKAFYKCTKLTTVGNKKNTITLSKVKTIGSSAFYGCKAVKKVNLTSTALTKIEDSAFQGCTSMTSFTSKSAKLTSIGKKAFYGDRKLGTVSLKTEKLKKSKTGSNAFKGIKSTCNFKVPKKQVSTYKAVFKAKGAGSKLKVSKL